jgi:hypothetical protein
MLVAYYKMKVKRMSRIRTRHRRQIQSDNKLMEDLTTRINLIRISYVTQVSCPGPAKSEDAYADVWRAIVTPLQI